MSEVFPVVSICIPTYNGAKYIAQTIQSVLDQSISEFEIIISDDGSTDRTLEIVRSFSDPRITRIESLSKVGAEANWNNSVAHARSNLIKLVCQDDLLFKDCLKIEVALMTDAANKDVAFCYHLRDFVTPNGRFIKGSRLGNKGSKKFSKEAILKKIVRSGGNPIGEPMAVTFRKSAFELAGQFAGDYVIDLDMWSRLLNSGGALFIEKRLSAFRISKTSWTSSLAQSQFSSVFELSKKLRQQNPQSISQGDLRRGFAIGLIRTPVRQISSTLILFADRFFRSAR